MRKGKGEDQSVEVALTNEMICTNHKYSKIGKFFCKRCIRFPLEAGRRRGSLPRGLQGRSSPAWSADRGTSLRPRRAPQRRAVISFLYFKKIKFQKYISVVENFKNIPRSPYGGRQGSNVIFFFFKFATKSLERKKRGGLSPPQRAIGSCPPLGVGGDRPPLFFLQGLCCKFEE